MKDNRGIMATTMPTAEASKLIIPGINATINPFGRKSTGLMPP